MVSNPPSVCGEGTDFFGLVLPGPTLSRHGIPRNASKRWAACCTNPEGQSSVRCGFGTRSCVLKIGSDVRTFDVDPFLVDLSLVSPPIILSHGQDRVWVFMQPLLSDPTNSSWDYVPIVLELRLDGGHVVHEVDLINATGEKTVSAIRSGRHHKYWREQCANVHQSVREAYWRVLGVSCETP
ncbi:hypothetical protein shim_30460 [Shimia sp. SK013]|nr:hypothetical protein shim_30460 [Shimia sp. SK013]